MGNIFEHIVAKEDDHTHLLRSMMERHLGITAAVLSFLLQRPMTEDEAAGLSFKVHPFHTDGVSNQIPDMVVEGASFRCVIEVKLNPMVPMTRSQREGYLSCFPCLEKGDYTFCLLVPSNWKHHASALEMKSSLRQSIKFRISCWPDLINALRLTSPSINDQVLEEAVHFWSSRFEVEPMTSDEQGVLRGWSSGLFSAVSTLNRAVLRAKAQLEARGWNAALEQDKTTCGFHLKRDNEYFLWLGVWSEAPVPLCMGVPSSQVGWTRPRDFALAPLKTNDQKWHLWPLPQEAWGSAEKIVTCVTDFVQEQYDPDYLPPRFHKI